MRTLAGLVSAFVAHVPASAEASDWDIAKVGSNFDLVSLSEADLSLRAVTTVAMGDVILTSGHIVATDLLVQPDRPAFVRTVSPGHYPVTLYEAFGRVAAAGMRFAGGKPVRWEIATIAGQDAATLKGDDIFGYSVDSGIGSFMDAETYPLVAARAQKVRAEKGTDTNYYDDVLASELARNNDDFALHVPIDGKPGNVAVFSSGWGDGFYPSFWGLDADGRPLVLLTDFYVMANADGRHEPPQE